MNDKRPSVVSLGELLESNPAPPPCLIEPGLLPAEGILFIGGEPKLGKSILVTNLALALAAGCSRTGFDIHGARRVLICQFELPTEQFAARLAEMRKPLGASADANLFIDTCAAAISSAAPRASITSSPPPEPPPQKSLSLIRSTPPTTRTKTTRAPWPHSARACCACAMPPKPP